MMYDLLNGRCANDVYLTQKPNDKKVKIKNSDAPTSTRAEITVPLKHVSYL